MPVKMPVKMMGLRASALSCGVRFPKMPWRRRSTGPAPKRGCDAEFGLVPITPASAFSSPVEGATSPCRRRNSIGQQHRISPCPPSEGTPQDGPRQRRSGGSERRASSDSPTGTQTRVSSHLQSTSIKTPEPVFSLAFSPVLPGEVAQSGGLVPSPLPELPLTRPEWASGRLCPPRKNSKRRSTQLPDSETTYTSNSEKTGGSSQWSDCFSYTSNSEKTTGAPKEEADMREATKLGVDDLAGEVEVIELDKNVEAKCVLKVCALPGLIDTELQADGNDGAVDEELAPIQSRVNAARRGDDLRIWSQKERWNSWESQYSVDAEVEAINMAKEEPPAEGGAEAEVSVEVACDSLAPWEAGTGTGGPEAGDGTEDAQLAPAAAIKDERVKDKCLTLSTEASSMFSSGRPEGNAGDAQTARVSSVDKEESTTMASMETPSSLAESQNVLAELIKHKRTGMPVKGNSDDLDPTYMQWRDRRKARMLQRNLNTKITYGALLRMEAEAR